MLRAWNSTVWTEIPKAAAMDFHASPVASIFKIENSRGVSRNFSAPRTSGSQPGEVALRAFWLEGFPAPRRRAGVEIFVEELTIFKRKNFRRIETFFD